MNKKELEIMQKNLIEFHEITKKEVEIRENTYENMTVKVSLSEDGQAFKQRTYDYRRILTYLNMLKKDIKKIIEN